MPRTAVTAKMTTGGLAKRVAVAQPATQDADSQMKQKSKLKLNLQHCSMCQDGGTIWQCDEDNCERAVCSLCIEIPPEELSKLDHKDVSFKCVRCHWTWAKKENKNVPYIGFTYKGQPVLKNFLKVNGRFEASIGATVQSPPTVLLHIRLDSIIHITHFTMVEDILSEYYHNENSFQCFDLPFNLGQDKAVEKWERNAKRLISGLSAHDHVIVFVTTHSVPDNGDLWLGKNENNEACATPTGDWLNAALGPFKPILNGSILYMLTCGAVINQPISFAAFKQGLISLGVANALAFDASNLSTVNTVELLTKVTKSVVIHGFSFTEALEHALKHSFMLGKHSNVFHFTPEHVTQYLWAHKDYQPWGTLLPLQCPQCGILNGWTVTFLRHNHGYGIECSNGSCGKVNGKKLTERISFEAPRPDFSDLINVGKDAAWMKMVAK